MKNPFENQNVLTKQDIEEYRDFIVDTEGNEDEVKDINALLDDMGDWALIKESYFVEYITDIIEDCYDDVKPKNKTNWPYYCVSVDYELAARDAKMDYTSITFKGVNYLAR